MLHVYFLHSGITIIAAYDHVKRNLEKGNEVVIVTSRGIKWPFFLNSLQVVNLDELLKGKGEDLNLRKASLKTIFKQLKDWKRYQNALREIINDQIVKGRDYIMYLPIYLDEFVRHPNCKGYYFLEEGVFAYYDRKYVTKIARKTFQTRVKRVAFPFFGEHYFPIDYVGKLFLGSVAISEQAFPWHQNEHIISDITSYIDEVGDIAEPYETIIVTDVLFQDNPTIKKCLEKTLDFINKEHPGRIAIKMHPMMYTKYKEKAHEVEGIIRDLNQGEGITILPQTYIIENNIFKYHTEIISLFELSSLSLYAICFDAKTFLVRSNGDDFIFERLTSVPQIISIISGN